MPNSTTNSTASGGASGGAAGSGAAAAAAMAASFAQRQILSEQLARYWAAGICGLVALNVLIHWLRWIYTRATRSSKKPSVLALPFIAISRLVRNILVRKVPGFTSAGHVLLVGAYVAINCSIAFTNVDLTNIGSIAQRFGWITILNLTLVVFLALKNTPLAFLTAYSYERLQPLHQIAGYTMFSAMVIHASMYSASFISKGKISILQQDEQTAAIIAGFSFLAVVFSATFIRRWWYELFHIIHITFFIVGVVCVCLHQPDFSKKIATLACLAAAMWATDRLLRFSRILFYAANNDVTVYPLPDGATRVVIKKVPARAVPGKHVFLWVPRIRPFEMHPFTIAGTKPLELIINACDGFTRDLHKYATKNPGAKLMASTDGPYGTFPDPLNYDKVVLIAGGSGASYTFGLAGNLIERMGANSEKNIVFIWAVKKHDTLTWYNEHLEALRTHPHSPRIDVSLYVTRMPPSTDHLPHLRHHGRTATFSSLSSGDATGPSSSDEVEKAIDELPTPTRNAINEGDIEKELIRQEKLDDVDLGETGLRKSKSAKLRGYETTTTSTAVASPVSSNANLRLRHKITHGRPDVATLIRAAVSETPSGQRVLVAACGPDGLMKIVRNTTAGLIRGDGPAVELHCEQFGW